MKFSLMKKIFILSDRNCTLLQYFCKGGEKEKCLSKE